MALTDLLKSLTSGAALTGMLYSCGDTSNYYGNGSGGNNGNGNDRCTQLCERVWRDCNGLPKANYFFGTSYNDCREGCPDFLEGVNRSPYAEGMNDALDCVIDVSDCDSLERDACDLDEGDLFEKYSL